MLGPMTPNGGLLDGKQAVVIGAFTMLCGFLAVEKNSRISSFLEKNRLTEIGLEEFREPFAEGEFGRVRAYRVIRSAVDVDAFAPRFTIAVGRRRSPVAE